MHRPVELPGLQVRLDRLVYRHDPENTPPDRPHVFIYFITIENQSERTVTLVGRRWVIEEATGRRQIVEGDKIVGETPCLPPGGHFSYNSFHITACSARVQGSFHGLDDEGHHVKVRIPPFNLAIP